LALVREVVETHRGRITVVGAPGRGAAFTLHLPAARS
jgi:signal transduction histidine kinase